MKIVCDSCGAKYSIADEKVAGKVFKIRCKKCSAVIVVKGDQEESDEATRVYDYGAEAVWHVVVGGDQQGPVTPRQIGELLAEGRIDWEAYVWREGMDGWQPAKDVEPLVNAIMAESEGASGPEAVRASGPQAFAGSADMGADPFAGGDDGGLSGVLGQSSASAAAAGGTADLFAQSSSSPFAGSDDALTVGPGHSSPRVSESEAMTGQRNENSVLFSLSNLQALATGSGGAPASTRPNKPGMAQGEGSGLIDIRALAAATQAVPNAPSNGSSRDKVEDLLAVGAAGTGFSAATLAAPVVAEKADNSKIMLGGMAAAILLLGAAVGYLALREPEIPQAVLAAQGPAGAQAPTAASAPAAQAAAMPTAQADQAAEPAPAAKPSARSDDEDDNDKSESSRSERKSRRSSDSSSSSSSSKTEKEPAAAAPAPAPKASSTNSADKSIDDLLGAALGGGKPAAKSAAKPAETLPSSPSRDDVLSAMKGVTPRVQACGGGQSGIATSKVTVTGATGRVTSVDVSGQFAGTPVASCVVKEVSKARFPKFSQATFSFSYPFKI